MNWLKLKYIVIDLGLLALRYWWLVLGLIVVVFVAVQIDGCRQRGLKRKLDRIDANITEQKTIGNVLENRKADINSEVNTHEQNSNNARNELDNSRRSDSGNFAAVNAEDKFCRRFCEDSTCFEWRRRNPGYVCN